MPDEKDTILQNTDHGYEATTVDEIPLSDKAGEGRVNEEKTDARERPGATPT